MESLQKSSYLLEYPEMEKIGELLRCGICHDYIETAVMTPCSHNYCSLCIRKYLHYKTQCPACFQMTFEKDLHVNRLLDELLIQFIKVRDKLISCTTDAKKKPTTDDNFGKSCKSLEKHPLHPRDFESNHKRSKSQTNEVIDITTKPSLSSDVSETDATKLVNKMFPSSIQCTNSRSTDSTIDITDDSKLDTKKIPCSVCKVEITSTHFNRHLDECKVRNSTQKGCLPRPDSTRKIMPKLVLNLMKDSELRKKMKQFNLPTQGDRRTLENRFQRYCTLYNAEFDKKNPRPVQAILEQCKTEELIEKKLAKSSLGINSVKTLRNAEQSVIDETNQNYLRTNNQSYQHLIESIKNRMKSGMPNHGVSSNEDHALTCMASTEGIQTGNQVVPLSSDPVTSDHHAANSSDLPIINTSEQQKTAKTCDSMDHKLNPMQETITGNIAIEKTSDEEQLDIHSKVCSSNDSSVDPCHAIGDDKLTMLGNDADKQAEFIESVDGKPTVPLSNEVSQLETSIDVACGTRDALSSTSDSCAIKRRRRQKCDSSIVKSSQEMHAKL